MTALFQEPDDTTPLEPQEREGLRQTWITHRRDLNEAEQENIVEGAVWARGRRRMPIERMLSEDFVRTLHKRMFGEVWEWAGTFRATERNIGIQAYRIGVELGGLLRDVHYWIEHQTFSADEIAVRFHHRLVAIHPFPNGNGRHARLAADLLVERLGRDRFSWAAAAWPMLANYGRATLQPCVRQTIMTSELYWRSPGPDGREGVRWSRLPPLSWLGDGCQGFGRQPAAGTASFRKRGP